MLKILIIDDSLPKQENIKIALNEGSYIPIEDITIASCTKEARMKLYSTKFDLMILDLVLPIEKDSNDVLPENGLKLLNEISTNPSIKPPLYIVGLSGFNELIIKHLDTFKEKLWHLIPYEENSDEWQNKLNAIVQHLIKVRHDFLNISLENQFDTLLNQLRIQNYPIVFLGDNWKKICKNIIDIIKRSLEVPSKFSNGTKASNININTIKLKSEYDFQNLIHLVLRPWLPSVEAENIAIIFDGNTKNADFSINANSIIIEAKYIDTNGKKNDVMKTIEGLKNFYSHNANVKSLIFLLLVNNEVTIDIHKIENEFSVETKEPYIFVSVIKNIL